MDSSHWRLVWEVVLAGDLVLMMRFSVNSEGCTCLYSDEFLGMFCEEFGADCEGEFVESDHNEAIIKFIFAYLISNWLYNMIQVY